MPISIILFPFLSCYTDCGCFGCQVFPSHSWVNIWRAYVTWRANVCPPNKCWTIHLAQKRCDWLNHWGIKVLSLMHLTHKLWEDRKKRQSFCISFYCPCGCLTHPGCVKWPIPSMWLVQVLWSVESGQSALLPVFIGLDPDLTGCYLYSLPLLLTGVCICTVSQPWPPECIALSELISNHKLPLFEKPKTTTVLPRRLNRCDHLSVYSSSAPLPVNIWVFLIFFFLALHISVCTACGDRASTTEGKNEGKNKIRETYLSRWLSRPFFRGGGTIPPIIFTFNKFKKSH